MTKMPSNLQEWEEKKNLKPLKGPKYQQNIENDHNVPVTSKWTKYPWNLKMTKNAHKTPKLTKIPKDL